MKKTTAKEKRWDHESARATLLNFDDCQIETRDMYTDAPVITVFGVAYRLWWSEPGDRADKRLLNVGKLEKLIKAGYLAVVKDTSMPSHTAIEPTARGYTIIKRYRSYQNYNRLDDRHCWSDWYCMARHCTAEYSIDAYLDLVSGAYYIAPMGTEGDEYYRPAIDNAGLADHKIAYVSQTTELK